MPDLSPWPIHTPLWPKAPATIDPTWSQWLSNLVLAVNAPSPAGPAAAGTLTGTTLAANVVNSSLTSVGTLVNLTVTNPIVGSVTGSSGSTSGNAATATALQTPRAINGVNFDGTAAITVTAAAGTLTGATLAATVLASSLTSTGTLTGGATGAGFTVALSTSTITGTLADARLSSNVPLKNGTNAFTGANSFATNPLDLLVGQLAFPATQNPSAGANTLDDYEEGTWTPNDASGAGLAFVGVSGSFLKIGQLVVATGNLQFPATASGATVLIGGLPFTARNAAPEAGAFITFTNSGLALYLRVIANSTTIAVASNAGTATLNSALSNATIHFTAVYRATA